MRFEAAPLSRALRNGIYCTRSASRFLLFFSLSLLLSLRENQTGRARSFSRSDGIHARAPHEYTARIYHCRRKTHETAVGAWRFDEGAAAKGGADCDTHVLITSIYRHLPPAGACLPYTMIGGKPLSSRSAIATTEQLSESAAPLPYLLLDSAVRHIRGSAPSPG